MLALVLAASAERAGSAVSDGSGSRPAPFPQTRDFGAAEHDWPSFEVPFRPDGAALLPEAALVLEELANALRREPEVMVLIGGSDGRGLAPADPDLAFRRAAAIASYLAELGIGPGRILDPGASATRRLVFGPARGVDIRAR